MGQLHSLLQGQPVVPTLLLFLLLLFAFFVLVRAQRRPDFDLAEMLKDETGRISGARAFAFVSLAVTSWIVTYQTISGSLEPQYFFYYITTWSGASVAMALINKWDGSIPFVSKPTSNQPITGTSTTG